MFVHRRQPETTSLFFPCRIILANKQIQNVSHHGLGKLDPAGEETRKISGPPRSSFNDILKITYTNQKNI